MSQNKVQVVKKNDERFRYFFCILYLESFNNGSCKNREEVINYFSSISVNCVISCCHDSDLKSDGEPAKEHFHILFYYKNKKSVKKAKEFCKLQGLFYLDSEFVARDYKACVRYMIHADNNQKFQYNKPEQIPIANYDIDIQAIIWGIRSDIEYTKLILNFIIDERISTLNILIDKIIDKMPECFSFVLKKQVFFNNYLRAKNDYYKMIRYNQQNIESLEKMLHTYDDVLSQQQSMIIDNQQLLLDTTITLDTANKIIENNIQF